ncbi:unnamed protein product [Alopecurus aequalis]
MPPTPRPTLPEELLEEIFLRLPPDEPEWLVRASLASKLWHGLLSGPHFGRRYRELHRAHPMLGFLRSAAYERMKKYLDPRFVSTGKFSPRFPQDKYRWDYGYDLWDCRHGRVLYGNTSHGAAVLCAVTGCDHTTCHNGPFRVVLVGVDTSDGGRFASVQESFSHMGTWTKPCSHLHLANVQVQYVHSMTPVLTEDALYFMLLDDGDEDDDYYAHDIAILKYDMASNGLSLIDTPLSGIMTDGFVVLMAMADGSLGFARVKMLTLYLWSRQMGSNGVASWNARRVIDLGDFLPIQNPNNELKLIGSMEGADIIYVTTDLGIYQISLKSLEWKKIWKSGKFQCVGSIHEFL